MHIIRSERRDMCHSSGFGGMDTQALIDIYIYRAVTTEGQNAAYLVASWTSGSPLPSPPIYEFSRTLLGGCGIGPPASLERPQGRAHDGGMSIRIKKRCGTFTDKGRTETNANGGLAS